MLLSVTGCSGCRDKDTADQDKKKKKTLTEYQFGELRVQPSDESTPQRLVKPGHFQTATLRAKANLADVNAEMLAAAVDSDGSPLPVDFTAFALESSRRVALPQGQEKNVETIFFIPTESKSKTTTWLKHQLRAARSGRDLTPAKLDPAARLPGYEYFVVVLAASPDSYGFLKQLHTVNPPHDELSDRDPILYYRIMLPRVEQGIMLPGTAMCWTSISVIVWDQIDPNLLRPDQQQAMLDWLHWGGQLIINGPNSLDSLRGSFLEPMLPATKQAAVSFEQADFEELNQNWSLTSTKSGKRLDLAIVPGRPILGVTLEPHLDAQFVPGTGRMVAERRVGRGRVVVTAFTLYDRDVLNWGSLDSFVNGCLLRRPQRRFHQNQTLTVSSQWTQYPNLETDVRFSTALRYFTRDSGPLSSETVRWDTEHWMIDGFRPSADTGPAAWNDFSGASDLARQSLQEAAGISIPKADFVLKVLAVYLVILVPANWGLFRLLGRVEWAWVATPVIAVVGALAVVQLAQLDIGFVRSRTELGILELQPNYHRGHMTRFAALYSSLSTGYDLSFDTPSAVARPFPSRRVKLAPTSSVRLRRDPEVTLSDYQVDSNTTGMVHSEQMTDVGGVVELTGNATQGYLVKNGTRIPMQGVGVLRRDDDGQLQGAWVGDLPPQATQPLRFEPLAMPWLANWEQDPITSAGTASKDDRVRLGPIMQLAASQLTLRVGEARLIGWSSQPIEGLSIEPAASQDSYYNVIVCQLRFAALPDTGPDANLFVDVKGELDEQSGAEFEVLPGVEEPPDRSIE